jgi:hypothetical protein
MPAVQRNFLGFAKGPEAMDAEALFARFPGLGSTREDERVSAL